MTVNVTEAIAMFRAVKRLFDGTLAAVSAPGGVEGAATVAGDSLDAGTLATCASAGAVGCAVSATGGGGMGFSSTFGAGAGSGFGAAISAGFGSVTTGVGMSPE